MVEATEENLREQSTPLMASTTNLPEIRKEYSPIVDHLVPNDIVKMFDKFLDEFKIMEKNSQTTVKTFLDAVDDTISVVLLITPSKLLDPTIFGHQFFVFLRQIIIDVVENWQASRLRLSKQEADIFLKIVLIFLHAFEQSSSIHPEEDRKRIRNFLATNKLLALIREQVSDTMFNKRGINDDRNISILGLLTIVILKECEFFFSKQRNRRLFDTLVYNCLDSIDYIRAVRKFQRGEELNDLNRFLLFTCWEYIPFEELSLKGRHYSTNIKELDHQFYDELLTRFETILDEPTITTPDALSYIFQRSNQLLTVPNLTSFDNHASNLVERLTNTLKDPKSLAINHTDHDAVVNAALQTFNNMSNHFELCSMMKKYPLRSVIEPYAQNRTDEKGKLAFAVLAEIMNEQEIQTNANQLTSNLIGQLKELYLNGDSAQCDKSFSSLNALMQNEEIKREFVKQGGLDTLVSFIRDGDLNGKNKKQVEAAMQTLWSCAFGNPEALDTLKQDKELMARVNQILKESKECGDHELEKAAEGLIWKVEKEGKFLEERMAEAEKKRQERQRKAAESGTVEEEEEEEEEKPKYDCMISYSIADKDLAHRVFESLTQKHNYKVWLDKEARGLAVEAMANAVESAEYFLMFMSQTYKRSANCQSEAEYAFNRKKHIVPIKVKKDYAADGWLGFILGTRLYIDFGTYDFDKAMQLLVNEIELQKKKKRVAVEIARMEKQTKVSSGPARTAISSPVKEEHKMEEKLPKTKKVAIEKAKKSDLLNWDKEKVQKFLTEHNLISMLALCNGMGGEELLYFYKMCLSNSPFMYHSLQEELMLGCTRVLPICTYLRFMSLMDGLHDF